MLNFNHLTPGLRSVASQIMASDTPTLTQITAVLKNDTYDESRYEFPVKIIDSLKFSHDYLNKFAEEIEFSIRVTMDEYLNCVRYSQGLKCILTMNTIDGRSAGKGAKTIKTYIAFIIDKVDPELFIPGKIHEQPDTSQSIYPIKLQLIEEKLFELAKKSTNFILGEHALFQPTVRNAIEYFIGELGIKHLMLYPPDNGRKYRNIIIPPKVNIANFFSYLQLAEPYGIYDAGCAWFYRDDMLTIYPPYKMKTERKLVTRFYYVGNMGLPDNQTFHAYGMENTDIANQTFVLINSPLSAVYPTDLRRETRPTAFNLYCDNNVINGINQVSEQYKGELVKNTKMYYAKEVSSTLRKGSDRIAYATTSGNIFRYLSILSESERAILKFDWSHARLGCIEPGGRIQFHYDGFGRTKMRSGICSSVVYTFTPLANAVMFRDAARYACSAEVELNVAPLSIDCEEEIKLT